MRFYAPFFILFGKQTGNKPYLLHLCTVPYAINQYSKNPVFQINTHIGFDADVLDESGKVLQKGDGFGIVGKDFSREFFECDCLSPDIISTYVNCMGGGVRDGFEIFNSIINAKSKTETIYAGFAFSTGGWCGMGADKIKAYDYSVWMCHMPYDPNDESKKSPFLDMAFNSVATIISQKSGRNGKQKMTVDQIKQLMLVKTYLTAYELYDMGLIDEVISSSNNRKTKIDITSSNIKNDYMEHCNVVNKFINDNFNKRVMTPEEQQKLQEMLNLQHKNEVLNKEVVSFKEQVEAFNREKANFTTQLSAMQVERDSALNKVKEGELALTESTQKMEVVNKELEELRSFKEDAINKEKELQASIVKEKATNLVNKYVEVGKIKNDEKIINGWIDQAVVNYAGTELILETLRTDFQAPKPIKPSEEKQALSIQERFRADNRERLNKTGEKIQAIREAIK